MIPTRTAIAEAHYARQPHQHDSHVTAFYERARLARRMAQCVAATQRR